MNKDLQMISMYDIINMCKTLIKYIITKKINLMTMNIILITLT